MSELDFDELDRAVNSLMTDVPQADKVPEDAPIKTLTIPSSTTTDNASLAAAPSTTRTSAPVSVAARRGGRFMDVVHPALDMKKPETPSRSPVSRQGATITPSSLSGVSAEPAPSVQPQPAVEQKKPDMPAPSEPSHVANEWPDPLELADFKHEPVEEKTDTQEAKDDQSNTPPVIPDEPSEPAPLTSPFLPDTKVEKRPLGGSVPAGETLLLADNNKDNTTEDFTVNDPNAQLPPAPSDVEPQLPEELQGDLVAIESGASGGAQAVATNDEPKEAVSDKKTTAHSQPEASAPLASAETKVVLASSLAGSASIPQQYREEPSTGDQKNGSIYDTDAYHKPLAHPGKKKSGWLMVLWIVLILVVGAGIGAALYFLGIV